MKIFILLFATLFLFHAKLVAQSADEKILFVVDSIPVINDPEEGNGIMENEVAEIIIIKNKDTLNLLGYGQYSGVTFLFTKEYRNRSESIKRIPSSKQMERKNGAFVFRNNLYNGQYIDYFFSGRKLSEGTFMNGKLNGLSKFYFQNGQLAMERRYINGIENGFASEYYEDGSLKQKGEFENGKEEGIWESFYPNCQVKMRSKYKKGYVYDTATKYYSSGKIKEIVFINNAKVNYSATQIKINDLMASSSKSNKEGNAKGAIKYCTKVIEIDSTYAAAYFSRGTIKLNQLQFDDAIADFDKALMFEPFMEFALANRAFAKIRKHQFKNSRTISKNSEVTILASKDKVFIPEIEQQHICNDLRKAFFLGNKNNMISEALTEYCGFKKDH